MPPMYVGPWICQLNNRMDCIQDMTSKCDMSLVVPYPHNHGVLGKASIGTYSISNSSHVNFGELQMGSINGCPYLTTMVFECSELVRNFVINIETLKLSLNSS